MSISYKLDITESKLSKDILESFLSDITKDFQTGIIQVKSALPKIVHDIVLSSPEYDSLVGGMLRYHFGIPDADDKIKAMIRIWSNNIQYNITYPKLSGNRIVGSFGAHAFKADFSDILGTDYAKVYDNAGGYSLPWLEWLVLDGSATLVPNHDVVLLATHRSRTGGALMMRGSGWGVPSIYSGTIADNWITRAIAANNFKIEDLLQRAF